MCEQPTILVVDDDSGVRSILEVFLREEGYVTEIAEDGLAALELFEKAQIDVALVDLKMPGIDGVELCKRIKKKSPRTEVIIVTGCASKASAIAALREGTFDYILKPPDPMEIYHSVEQALEKQRLLAEREQFVQELSVVNEKRRQRERELEKEVEERTRAITESERRWRTLFKNANDAIFTMDTSGLLRLFNPEAEKFSGYKAEEVKGKSLETLVSRGSKKRVRGLIDRTVLEGATVFGQEVKMRRKDGSELIIEINTAPMYDEGGQVVGGLGTARDVTRRKQAERRLRELNRKLSAKNREMETLNRSLIQAYAEVRAFQETFHYLLDSVNNAVLFLELDGTITGINGKAKELFGYSRDQFLKMRLRQLMPQSFSERTEEMLKRLRMGLSDSFEAKVCTKNKETLRLEWDASVVEREKKRAGLIFLREPLEKIEEWIKDSEEEHSCTPNTGS